MAKSYGEAMEKKKSTLDEFLLLSLLLPLKCQELNEKTGS